MRVGDAPRLLSSLACDAVRAVRDEVTGRRAWVRGGRAHIEARAAHHPDAPAGYVAALEHGVEALDGVRWAAVNGVLGDLVVDFDHRRVSAGELRSAVGRVEREHGTASRRRDRPPHPGEFAAVSGGLAELVGDLVGAGIGLAGRTIHGISLPAEVMSLLAAVDFAPGLRRRMAERLGVQRTELALSLAGSALSAVAQAPMASLVDAALRAVELPAALGRRLAWENRAVDLAGDRRRAKADPLPPAEPRPLPLPDGPVERHIRRAGLATALAAAALLPTGGPLKAARVVVIGAPKAARMGRDAYAAELSRVLATRGVIVRRQQPLRHLDRIDTVMIDAAVLTAGGTAGGGGADGGGAELDPLARSLVAAARAVGRVVVTNVRSRLADRVGADTAMPGGSRLAASVRELQAQGRTVALIATRNDPALAAADCGIGLVTTGRRPPWAADMLCGPGLEDAWVILQATVAARGVAARGAQFALLGTVSGALAGLLGPERGAGARGALPVNLAALASIVAGFWSANRVARRPLPVPGAWVPWHALALEEALRRLGSTRSGLSSDQADQRRAAVVAEPGPAEGLLAAAIAELESPLTAPLAAGAVLSAATGAVADAVLVAAALVGNAALSGVQRFAAGRAVRTLAQVGELPARLRRDGQDRVAPAGELVPGDVVVVQAGDAVVADCRLVEASHLEVDESALTGESMPVAKDPAPTAAAMLADRSSMLYAGTTVAAGTGVGVVVAVRRATEAGRSAAAADAVAGGVESRLRDLAAATVPAAGAAAGALLVGGLVRGRLAESVGSAVALAVAAVPEGLPFTATAAQLAAARRLSRRNVLVRTPRTLEALGRVNVVCFDKTGTLTAGRIELRRVSDATVDEPVDALTGERPAVLAAALRAGPPDNGEVPPHPTDRAVAAGGEAAGVTRESGEPGWRMVQELPFEPGRGFHAVLGRTARRQLISVKGAPEIVFPRCVSWRDPAGGHPLTDEYLRRLVEQVERLARRGYRVLAVAERSASRRRDLDAERVERLEFLGLLALADPVRPTAAEAVRDLRRAGVDVVMLTGDHPSTAEAIAAELGLLEGYGPVTGPELDDLDDAELAEVAAETSIFARVSPGHKVTIVQALRRAGRVVAVTGDGANDAPAIRLADVGLAFGERGTAAARQAADIVVTDDRIETIVDAVIESRAMWRSVRDSVGLLLGGNLGEIAFTLGSSLATTPPPLGARQLLLVNLLTDLVPALAVAVRPPRRVSPEALLREGPDAAVGDPLTRKVLVRATATAVATTGGWLAARATGTRGRASTVALASLVGAQLAQTAVAARGDPVVLAATVGSGAALAGLVQFPPTSVFFGCRPLGPLAWTIVLAAAAGGAVLGAVPVPVPGSRIRPRTE